MKFKTSKKIMGTKIDEHQLIFFFFQFLEIKILFYATKALTY